MKRLLPWQTNLVLTGLVLACLGYYLAGGYNTWDKPKARGETVNTDPHALKVLAIS